METIAFIPDPNSVEVTIALTMTVAEWRRLKGEIDKSGSTYHYVLGNVVRAIGEVVSAVEQKILLKAAEEAG